MATNNITTNTTPQQTIPLPEPVRQGGVPLMNALDQRRSIRRWANTNVSGQQLSDLLWASFGINSKASDTGKRGLRTAPTARNHQEIELFVFLHSGIYSYDAAENCLHLVREGDRRAAAGKQSFFADAPIALCIVAHYDKMPSYTEEKKDFYSAVDAGYVSQNIYLYCASAGLATVACGRIDRDSLRNLLRLGNSHAILSHPIGVE